MSISNLNERALSVSIAQLAAALANLENINAPFFKAITQADSTRLDVYHSDSVTRATDGKHVIDILPRKNSFTFSINKAA